MKPLQGDSVNVNRCSCTSCDSRSQSDCQALKRLLLQGSKINKLLTGKYYVHLRESDLLDKLNKTRALYDALRSQLLSSNESSTADLKPRQSSKEIRKAFVEGKKSSDMFALVDLVDKGAVLGLRKLSECCSCCTCSSKFHENIQKGRRNRLANAGGNIVSRSSFVSKQETGEAKNIKSDPCTCACFKKRQIKKNRVLHEKVCPAKPIAIRDHLSTPSNDINLMSINSAKLRKSYHKLKRAKAYPSPYMENIGEGGSKIVKKPKLASNTIKTKGSIELLKTNKNVKYSFETDRKALQKKEPETRSTIKNTAEENMSRPNTIAIKLKDKIGGNSQIQSSKLKQRITYRPRKINLPLEENAHIRDASSIPKEISFIKGHERKKLHTLTKQQNKKYGLTDSNKEITEHPLFNKESHSLKRSNKVKHSREYKIPSQKDRADNDKKNTKMLPCSFSPGKELITSNIATVSISSAKKRYPASHNKSSSNSLNKINKSNLKTRSSILFRKRLLLSTPLHFRPQLNEEPRQFERVSPVRHKIPLRSGIVPCNNCLVQDPLRLSEEPGRRKKPSKVKHKKNKSGSHGLKRCLCNIKLKINETKSMLSKNITNKNLVNDKQRSRSRILLSSVKTLKKESNNDPNISDHAVKFKNSEYETQTQAIRKNKQTTQNETNAYFEIKCNSADSNGSIEHSPAPYIFNKTKQSIHALISDCVCKEVEQFMYKHYGKPNINVGEKWWKIQDEHAIIDSSNRIVSTCECFDENIVSDEIGKSTDRGKSNTRLRIKSTLKDASITTEQTWKLQNQAVQTVMNSSTYKTHKQKREKSLKHLAKKVTYDSNPRFSIELMNTVYSNDGLKITESKDNCVYKCGEGIGQLPTNQSQTSTTTTTKRDSHRIKNIHSILISQNNQMLPPILKKNKIKLPDMHRLRPYVSRKFYMNKRTSCLYCPVDKGNKIKQDSKILKNDTENLQKIMLLENTITGKEQTLLFDVINKPCVCTSKLRKGKYYRKSSVVHADIKSDKIMPGFQIDANVTKCKTPNQLGKCKCNLDEYSKKNKSNKYFQILTEKLKVTSDSSDKQLKSTSKLHFVKSDFQQRNSSIQKFKKMQINSESSHQPQYAKEIYLDNILKQNVRMASNFSFNIELYKSITSENNCYQNRIKNMKDHCFNNKQANNFLTKRYSSSHLIHLGNKKVSPINKCFCTLEISKMDEQRRNSKFLSPFRTKKLAQNYALSTVTIAENKIKTPEILKVDHNFHCIDSYHSTSYSNNISNHIKHWQYFNKNPRCGFSISMIAFKAKNIQSYIRESKYKLLQIRSREQSLLDFDSNEAIRFESAFSCEVDYLKNICSKKQPIIRNAHSQNNSIATCQHNPLANQSQLTGVQPLLRRCYCTMNIQVARSRPPQGLKYQTLPRSTLEPAHKQAVKIGSNFNFDIEFSKGLAKSAPCTADVVKVPARHVSSRSCAAYCRRCMDRGTGQCCDRHHRESQSMMKQMRHRASNVSPMLKRCFCTLKLQKKGRQQKELELQAIHQGTSTPPKFDVERPVLRTSERGTQKRRKFQELLPYECEPGICIPGECDPYECLELIKKRNRHTKDFGTDSMVSSMSSSSMTSGQKRKRKRIQARNIRQKQVRCSYTSVRSKPSVMSIETINRPIAKPSRQAVKISSNFSFNIEFYKDQTGGSTVCDRRPSEVYVHKAPKEVRRVPKKVHVQKRMREGCSQSCTSCRDDDSQIGIFQRGQSTMTSGYPERCFCTAKLQGYNIEAGTAARRPPSKLKRCFCTLKLLSKRHRIKDGGVGHERATSVGMTQTRGRGPDCVPECQGAVRTQTNLLPYECEPGICDPDNCDPYECIKLIRKRLAKEKMTCTECPRTKSTSSYCSSCNPSRPRMTQCSPDCPKTRMTQSRPAPCQESDSCESVPQEKIVTSSSRQAVRIGSNFSFNIEFYKEKGPNNLEMATPVVKKYRRPLSLRDRGHGAYRRTRTRDRGFRGRRIPSLSRDTQMESIQSRDVGLGPILRRCFCTLALQKKSKAKGKTKAESKTGSKAKSKSDAKAGSKTEKKAETSTETKAVQKGNHKCLCDPNQTNLKNEGTRTPPIKEVATLHDKSITTSKKPKENMKNRKTFPYKLEPYECEPGICVPGECDPYECLKLINKRLMQSSGTSTERRETRSSSNMAACTNQDCAAQSYVKHEKKMRTRETHTRHRPRTKMPQPRKSRRRVRGRRRDYALSECVLPEKPATPTSSQRQAVRIGSNFSFNIEFYKDKNPNNLEEQVSAPVVKRCRRPVSMRDRGHGAHRRARTRDKGFRGRRLLSLSRDTQMESIQSRDVSLGPILKRCFCTLKLQQKSKPKGKTKAESKTGSKAKSKSDAKAGSKPEKKAETSTETKAVQKGNHKCLCDPNQTNLKNEGTRTPPIKEVATLHDKSITTSKKPKENMKNRQAFPYKLEPYECEPGICVPGECDPYECLKLINKRLMYSSGTSTDPRGTRSTSNMAVCTNRDCEAQSYIQRKKQMRTKNTYTRHRQKRPHRDKRPHRERRPESRSSELRCTDVDRSSKQAVKIGSNFKFDIEFSKDKSNEGGITISKPIKQCGAYNKARRTSSRSTEGPSTNYRNQKAQRCKDTCNIDSQASGPSMRSTVTGTVAPFLKRCFCTLQLNCRTENQGTPFDCLVDITKAGKLKSQGKPEIQFTVNRSDRNKHFRTQAQYHDRNPSPKLSPYECESGVGFCVPDECDPYDCMKRIEKRTKQVGTIFRNRSFSSSTGEEKKNRPKGMQTRSSNPRRRRTAKHYNKLEVDNKSRTISSSSNERRKYRPRMKTISYTPSRRKGKAVRDDDQSQYDDTSSYRESKVACDTKPKRQTVRIGSNFNIDIEFFKENLAQYPGKPQVNNISKKNEKKHKRRRGAIRETITRALSTKSMSSYGKKYNPRDIQSQSKKTYSRGVGTPLLRRCFCTLKLEKKGKQFSTKKIDSSKCISKKLEPTTKCVSTHTKFKTKTIIEPVAQETGIKPKTCECDKGRKGHKCKCKKIKKNKKCECVDEEPPSKKISIFTAKEFPCKKGKECKCCKCNTYLEQNNIPVNQNNIPVNQNSIPVNQNNIPVNIDKCKCNKSKNKKQSQCLCEKVSQKIISVQQDNFPCKKGKDCKCCPCNSMNINKYRCKKGEICKCPVCNTLAELVEPNEKKLSIKQDQNIKPVNQDTRAKSKNKCKCNRYKKNKKTCECVAQAPPAPPAPPAKEPSIPFTCNKKTSTKKKYDPLKQGDLRDDCGVCERPNECLKKGDRCMNKPSGKHLKRRPRMSLTSIAASIVPGYTHKRTKYKGEPYSPDQIETIVEQPRYPFLHGKDARQGVKITSNFSFDIEFYKEMLPPVMDKVKEMNEDFPRKGKTKNRNGVKNDYKYSDDSDSEPERKASPFEILKKCFCTTKLQKSNYTQGLTVGRVQEIRPMSYFGPKQYLVQYQIQQPTRKYFKTNSQELKTIMSYRPSKYNKVYNNKRCYCHKCFNRSNTTIQRAQRKHSEVKETTFKRMLNICKNLFTKRSNKIDTNKSEGWTEFKKEATKQQPLMDILKASKSERHPKRVATAVIKKTKSLKTAKVNDFVYKKKYSRYQSGDHYISQNTGMKLVKRNCKHCQNKFRQTIPVHNKVPFSKLRTPKAFNSKQNDPVVIEKKKALKSISFLFESQKLKNSKDYPYPKVCSCCGGIKRVKNLLAGNNLDIKNKILEFSDDKTIIPKDFVGVTKTHKPERETTLSQENKEKNNQDRCCICMSNSKQKSMPDKTGVLRLSKNVICKKEAVTCAENYIEGIENKSEKYIFGTTIYPAKSEIKVLALGSAYKSVLDKKGRNKEPKQELHICENSHTAGCKEVIEKTMNVKYKLKNLLTIKTPGTRFVTESILANQDKLSDIGTSGPKSIYRKCQSYLRDHMQAWKKMQKVALTGHDVETMRRLQLSCETRKYVKGGSGKLETHPKTEVTTRFNNTDRKKGLHAKKPVLRRHSGSVFGWSPFMLSLRKRPWLSAYYKCAGFFPHCLTILKVWRQFMDIVLFMLAAAAVSPCLLGIELCKALKSCFLCKA